MAGPNRREGGISGLLAPLSYNPTPPPYLSPPLRQRGASAGAGTGAQMVPYAGAQMVPYQRDREYGDDADQQSYPAGPKGPPPMINELHQRLSRETTKRRELQKQVGEMYDHMSRMTARLHEVEVQTQVFQKRIYFERFE
jgi:hypothetical protein